MYNGSLCYLFKCEVQLLQFFLNTHFTEDIYGAQIKYFRVTLVQIQIQKSLLPFYDYTNTIKITS